MGRTKDRPATRGATIADVAQRAGVGVSTVSRVLNDGQVSAPARERVLSAMSDLGYRPRASARALASGSTQTLGMVIPFFTHPSAVERVRGVLAAVDEAPFDLVVCNVSDPAQRDEYLGRMAPLDRADGMLIVSLSPTDDEADAFLAAGAPIVLVDAHHPRLPSIVVDDVRGGRLATEHLIELGHERIACVAGPADVSSATDRVRGFRAALTEAGLPLPDRAVVEADFHFSGGREATARLLDSGVEFTALFAANDLMAAGAIRELSAHGVAVPHDVSVIGFDDAPLAQMISPALTTMRQSLQDMAHTAVSLLLSRVTSGDGAQPVRKVLPTSLVIRDSTAPPCA
jgi:LacI family transcriptional regulator